MSRDESSEQENEVGAEDVQFPVAGLVFSVADSKV